MLQHALHILATVLQGVKLLIFCSWNKSQEFLLGFVYNWFSFVFESKLEENNLYTFLQHSPYCYSKILYEDDLMVLRVETMNSKLMFCRNTQQTVWWITAKPQWDDRTTSTLSVPGQTGSTLFCCDKMDSQMDHEQIFCSHPIKSRWPLHCLRVKHVIF
jgi:hypothetical protein